MCWHLPAGVCRMLVGSMAPVPCWHRSRCSVLGCVVVYVAHAMVAEFEVRIIKAAATTCDEVSVSIDWKAYLYDGSDVMWSLKPPLGDMRYGEKTQNLNTKDVLKHRESTWELVFHRCGLEWGGALSRSLKSLAARSEYPCTADKKLGRHCCCWWCSAMRLRVGRLTTLGRGSSPCSPPC